jgi:hypothetical protein
MFSGGGWSCGRLTMHCGCTASTISNSPLPPPRLCSRQVLINSVPTHSRPAGLWARLAWDLVHDLSLGCTFLWCPPFYNHLKYYTFKPKENSIESSNSPSVMGEAWTRLLEVPWGFSPRLTTFGDKSWPADQSGGCPASLFPERSRLPIRTLILVNHISISIISTSSTSWKDPIWNLRMFPRRSCRAHLYVWFHHPLRLPSSISLQNKASHQNSWN